MTEYSITEKQCSICNEVKDIAAFGIKPGIAEKRRAACLACVRLKHQEHLKAMRGRTDEEIPTPTEKRCPRCKATKPAAEFPTDKRARNGLGAYCQQCTLEYYKERKLSPTNTKRPYVRKYSPDRRKQLRRFGLTLDDYEDMLEAQQSVCAICKKTQRTQRDLAVDHDHETGKIRGLLCDFCNRGLGYFFDRPDLLEAAQHYLLAQAPD